MKKIALLLFIVTAIIIFLGYKISQVKASSHALLIISFTNQGSSPTANVDYYVTDNFGATVVPLANAFVGSFSTANRTHTDPIANAGYTLHWTAQKNEAAAPGDFRCEDPETTFQSAGVGPAGDLEMLASVSFTCNLPPPGPSPATGLNVSNQVCQANNLVQVTFNWNAASGAASYQVGIEDNNNPGTWSGGGIVTGTSETWGNFPTNINQRWFVRAFANSNGTGATADSAIASFNTGPCPGAPSPSPTPTPGVSPSPGASPSSPASPPPGGISLTGSASCLAGTVNISLSWSGGSQPYNVYRDGAVRAQDISGTSYSESYDSDSTSHSWQVGTASLSSNTVSLNDPCGGGASPSPGVSCTGTAPRPPALKSPTDGSTVTGTTQTLDWDPVSSWGTNSCGLSKSYTVFFKRIDMVNKASVSWSPAIEEGTLEVYLNVDGSVDITRTYQTICIFDDCSGPFSSDEIGNLANLTPINYELTGTTAQNQSITRINTGGKSKNCETGAAGADGSGELTVSYSCYNPNNWSLTVYGEGTTQHTVSGLTEGKTYEWQVVADNGGGVANGVSLRWNFTVAAPQLDLKARFVNTGAAQIYNANETANLQVRVTNIGGRASAITTLGLWPTGSPLPNCPGTPQTPPAGQSYSVGALSPGAPVDVPVSFNVGPTPGTFTANAYVIPACNQADRYWPNNATNGTVWVGPDGVSGTGDDDVDGAGVLPGGFTYSVDINAWFETTGGDVGSSGDITVERGPAAGRFQSTYLLAGKALDTDLATQKGWKLANYNRPLIPSGGTYNYLAERFRPRAISEGYSSCTISAGSLPDGKLFGYCSGDASFNAGTGPNGNQVWFIDGNLTVSKRLVMGLGDTATFIVAGNITVDSTVDRIDGIYVAGGTFNSGSSGLQLVVNGAVYSNSVSLGRILAASGCGVAPCDNSVHPAEQINYDLKYLIGLNNVLGSPAVSWKEVAP